MYDNPRTAVYRFPAATLSAAATVGRIVGPAGKTGKVVDVGYVITTGTTVAATLVSIGITGTLGKFATNSVPIASADAVGSGVTHVANIDADAAVLVSSDGGCTAGAADLLVMIDWF